MLTAIAIVGLVLLFRIASGLWLGLAAWVVGTLLQAWAPLWQMLLAGVVLSLATVAVSKRWGFNARPAADFIAVVLLAPLSVIPTQTEWVIAAALAFAVAGIVLDRLTQRLRTRHRRVLQLMPIVLIGVIATQVTQPGNFGSRLLKEDPLFPLRVALVVPDGGTRVALESGATAWLQKTESREPRGTAIVMHGNHRMGSQQPSSMALQGALMRAGYDVLAVDHPGFGGSPAPHSGAAWQAWDPTLGPKQALKRISDDSSSPPGETIVVGHSMGVDVALKFVADGADVDAAYLFAGSLDRPHGPRWLSGFHRERNIQCCVPPAIIERVRDAYYGGGDRFAAALPEKHPVIHYVRFGIEHADVTVSREPLFAAILAAPNRLRLFRRLALLQYAFATTVRPGRYPHDPAHSGSLHGDFPKLSIRLAELSVQPKNDSTLKIVASCADGGPACIAPSVTSTGQYSWK